jgi:hypothetical protein
VLIGHSERRIEGYRMVQRTDRRLRYCSLVQIKLSSWESDRSTCRLAVYRAHIDKGVKMVAAYTCSIDRVVNAVELGGRSVALTNGADIMLDSLGCVKVNIST